MIKLYPFIITVVLICNADMPSSLLSLPIESGYGSHGTWQMAVDSIAHPQWRKHFVYLFYPKNMNKTIPVFFFCHGIGAENPTVYFQLIEHCVSQGYALIYSPYKKSLAIRSPLSVYKSMWDGFIDGVKNWETQIDTTRIGFIGHSYGAGAIPSFTYKAVTKKQWGTNGVFMLIMAPWYSYQISQSELASFPSNVKCVVEIFDADRINDHRMAIDIFNSIAIPPGEKDFITLFSDKHKEASMVAGHGVPEGVHKYGWDVNALDYYGVYRIVDALADYTYNNNELARSIALGGGTAIQCDMGQWSDGTPVKKLQVSDAPTVLHPQSFFVNFWNHKFNPRAKIELFFDTTGSKPVGSSLTIENYTSHFVYPKKIRNRTKDYLDEQGLKAKNDEDETYEDDGDPDAELPDSIDDNDLWPIPPIKSGFGAKGKYSVDELFAPHPSGGHGDLYCFSPHEYDGRMPVILFAPKLNADGEKYRQLLLNMASQGYLVIASTYRYNLFTTDTRRYEALLSGFEAILEIKKHIIDTTMIGFMGHAYGAGALPAVSWHFLKERQWGEKGAFLFMMSPSYVYHFSDEQFAQYPSHVNLVIEIYEEDHLNDFRIAEDIFYSINIPPSRKDFLYVRSYAHGDISYTADFQLPECQDQDDIEPILQYAIFRQCDALAAHTFYNNAHATKIALGNGSPDQTYMGTWWDGTPVRQLVSTDVPVFRNMKWLKPIYFMGFPALMNAVWPTALLCSFDDRRNPRRDKFVP